VSDLFLRACRGQPVERTPVWLMRQAGRYMEQYRRLREQHDFWTLCRTPELAAQVTLQPVERLGVDAAILFSDILVILPAMGCEVKFAPGPTLARPVRGRDMIAALGRPEPATDLGFVLEAIGRVRGELGGRVPLIGFGGAPFTLAAYLVEGQGSKTYPALRSLIYTDPSAAHDLLERLVRVQQDFLGAQIEAGAQAIQIFDSWGGILPRQLFAEFVAAPVSRLIDGLKRHGVPVIYYIRDCAHVLDLVAATGADVISLDEKLPLGRAAELIGPGPALQGNLDPVALLGDEELIRAGIARVLEAAPAGRGHVFNLGHGVLPQTPVESAAFLVEEVRRASAVERGAG
jgi:uroporphyrinogen decarboxylase